MKKPFDLSTKKMNAALSCINNYLPQFPGGTAASKYSESELVGLLEFLLPNSWRNAMDLKGFVPANNDRKELIEHCSRIERNETPIHNDKGTTTTTTKTTTKSRSRKIKTTTKKMAEIEPRRRSDSIAKNVVTIMAHTILTPVILLKD